MIAKCNINQNQHKKFWFLIMMSQKYVLHFRVDAIKVSKSLREKHDKLHQKQWKRHSTYATSCKFKLKYFNNNQNLLKTPSFHKMNCVDMPTESKLLSDFTWLIQSNKMKKESKEYDIMLIKVKIPQLYLKLRIHVYSWNKHQYVLSAKIASKRLLALSNNQQPMKKAGYGCEKYWIQVKATWIEMKLLRPQSKSYKWPLIAK